MLRVVNKRCSGSLAAWHGSSATIAQARLAAVCATRSLVTGNGSGGNGGGSGSSGTGNNNGTVNRTSGNIAGVGRVDRPPLGPPQASQTSQHEGLVTSPVGQQQQQQQQQRSEQEQSARESNKALRRARLRRLVQQYGPLAVATHLTISVSTLSVFYLAVSSGVDVQGLMKTHFSLDPGSAAGGVATFAVAYAAYKPTAVLRIPATLTLTPLLHRVLVRRGILSPLPKHSE